MRVFASVLLVVSSVFAYQITSPGDSQGWNNTGPNFLKWQRVVTDPPNFTVFLTNSNTGYDEVLDVNIDGTLDSVRCSTPSGGWPSGSGFRVNIAQDVQHPDSLLAQSDLFNIAAVNSSGSTMSASPQTTTSATAATATSSAPVSSSDTSTTPTATNAASPGVDTQTSLLIAIALTAINTILL